MRLFDTKIGTRHEALSEDRNARTQQLMNTAERALQGAYMYFASTDPRNLNGSLDLMNIL